MNISLIIAVGAPESEILDCERRVFTICVDPQNRALAERTKIHRVYKVNRESPFGSRRALQREPEPTDLIFLMEKREGRDGYAVTASNQLAMDAVTEYQLYLDSLECTL